MTQGAPLGVQPESRLEFARGSFLPKIAVRDETGQPTDLLALLEGRPALLLYLPRPHSPAARQAARRLAAINVSDPELVRAVLLPQNTHGTDAATLADLGIRTCIARDRLVSADERLLPWAATDKAGRVVDCGTVRSADVNRIAVRLREAAHASGETGGPASRTAPVLIVPEVLGPEVCKRLIAHFERTGGQPSGVLDLSGAAPQWRPDPAVKRRRDLMLEDSALIREVEAAVAARVLPEIRKCFHYAVTHHEPFKLVCYEEGSGYFRPHRDNESRDTLYRRFAMTINLNTGEYEGGALQFPEFGLQTYRPPLGGGIVFSCSLLHEATDVTRGRRYAVLGFFYNPDDGLER